MRLTSKVGAEGLSEQIAERYLVFKNNPTFTGPQLAALAGCNEATWYKSYARYEFKERLLAETFGAPPKVDPAAHAIGVVERYLASLSHEDLKVLDIDRILNAVASFKASGLQSFTDYSDSLIADVDRALHSQLPATGSKSLDFNRLNIDEQHALAWLLRKAEGKVEAYVAAGAEGPDFPEVACPDFDFLSTGEFDE
jgi:hypothetical protein